MTPLGPLLLLVLCLSDSNAGPQTKTFVWRFYLTENSTTGFVKICQNPEGHYTQGWLLTTTDCPSTGCKSPLFLNFTDFKNPFTQNQWAPAVCFLQDQPTHCQSPSSPWHPCMGCQWSSCNIHAAQRPNTPRSPSGISLYRRTMNRTQSFSLIISDPSDSKWMTLQRGAMYSPPGTPICHLPTFMSGEP